MKTVDTVFRSHGLSVVPWHELADLGLPMPVYDGGEGLGQIAVRLDPVQFAAFYEGGQDGPVL